jgi:hypothetical protein
MFGRTVRIAAAAVCHNSGDQCERRAGPNQTPPTGVSALFQEAYEVGDAPLCWTCGALKVCNGSCYKCVNCGGTS